VGGGRGGSYNSVGTLLAWRPLWLEGPPTAHAFQVEHRRSRGLRLSVWVLWVLWVLILLLLLLL
jgi:hypothetical protein